jgi:hypothetical protein
LQENRVFISHANEDAHFARRLAADIEQMGIGVWIAPESILPGEPWVTAIERGLAQSAHVIIMLSPQSVLSPWVKRETDAAISLQIKGELDIMPLEVKPCDVPLLLSTYQMISFVDDYDAGLRQVAAALGVEGGEPEPEADTPAAESAPEKAADPTDPEEETQRMELDKLAAKQEIGSTLYGEVIVYLADGNVQTHEIRKQVTRIGRYVGNDIVLPTTAASRYHATLEVMGERVALSAHTTVNGTYVNDEIIEPNTRYDLVGDEVIRIGDAMLFFRRITSPTSEKTS